MSFLNNLINYLTTPVVTLNHWDVIVVAILGFMCGIIITLAFTYAEKRRKAKRAYENYRKEISETIKEYDIEIDDNLSDNAKKFIEIFNETTK